MLSILLAHDPSHHQLIYQIIFKVTPFLLFVSIWVVQRPICMQKIIQLSVVD